MQIILLIVAVAVIGSLLSGLGSGLGKIFSSLSFAGVGFKIIVWLILIAIMIAIGRKAIIPMLFP